MNAIDKNVYLDFKPLYPLDLQGWTNNLPIFKKLIERTRPLTIIEVGTWKGRSAIEMARVAKELNLKCKIFCVDTWLGAIEFWERLSDTPERNLYLKNGYPQIYYQFLSNVVHTNHQDMIVPVPLPSNIAFKILKNKIQADLIYIDGSHETEDVYNDIKNYLPLLADNGIIFGDDYNWESVKLGVEQYSKEFSIPYQVDNINWIFNKTQQQ